MRLRLGRAGVISAHSQTIANQGEKKDGHREFHSPRRTSFTVSSPQPRRRFTPGPCNQDPNGAACWSLVAQSPGQKGAFVTDSSEPRRVDTKPLTTDAPLPMWGTRQGIGLSHPGDLGLADACDAAGPSYPPCIPHSQGGKGIVSPLSQGGTW